MTKTRVDDMLIEMISPRIKEIEERFARGEGLTQEDINTLLLKSQYNHINHLDDKLNEVVADVASLKGEFNGLKGEFNGLKGEFNGLRGDFNNLRTEFKLLETTVTSKLDTFKSDIDLKIQTAINTNMRWSIGMIALIVTVLKLADMFVK
ncbi:MAG TPA: hypothetical protein PLV58_09245 [Campylobacterales bacterium]|nr:hypothetical protein [Campylobacterales bacterium]